MKSIYNTYDKRQTYFDFLTSLCRVGNQRMLKRKSITSYIVSVRCIYKMNAVR